MKRIDKSRSKKTEITIAIIGLLGILATAVFSNWDKIFSEQKVIRVSYTDYRATGNFETELRYFFEVSGTRANIENMVQQLANNYKMALIAEHPENAEEIDAIMSAALEVSIRLDEIIKKLLPVYRKHYTIEEIQELNKFYSTEIIQNMIKKMPLLIQEIAPLQVELLQDYQSRLSARLNEVLD